MQALQQIASQLSAHNRSRLPQVQNLDKRKSRRAGDEDFHVPNGNRANRAHHKRFEAVPTHKHTPQPHLPTNMLTIASAHRGNYIKDSLTMPRTNDGNIRTAIEMSMGSFQAASDIVRTPIGVQTNSLGSRGMYNWPQKRIVQQ